MQISGILKFKPMPGTPTNPLLRQILRWVVWSQIPSKKERILLDSFLDLSLGLQTSSWWPWPFSLVLDKWMGKVRAVYVWAGTSHSKLTWKAWENEHEKGHDGDSSVPHLRSNPLGKVPVRVSPQKGLQPRGIPRVWKIPKAWFLLTEQLPQIVYAWFRSPWSYSLSDFTVLVTQRWFMWKQCSLFYVVLEFLTNFWCEFDLTEVKCFSVSVICGMFPFSHETLYL